MQLRKEALPSDSYVDSLYMLTVYCDDKNKTRLDKRAQVMLMTIDKKFPTFVTDYQRRFSQNGEKNSDICMLQKIMFLAACLESADKAQFSQYLNFARTLLQLFGGNRDVMTFLHRHVQQAAKLPIHDACIFQLPKEGEK
tara:strand:+ start:2031 stop:2450 length:420 start_codon:yes stop_codon:yes gene_type:complete